MLKTNERQAGDVTILDLEGNIIMGGGSAHLHDTIRRLIEEGKNKLVLNFAGVKYVDSSGIGELVYTTVTLKHGGGYLKLTNISEKVQEVMSLSNVLSVFEIYDDESGALNT